MKRHRNPYIPAGTGIRGEGLREVRDSTVNKLRYDSAKQQIGVKVGGASEALRIAARAALKKKLQEGRK